MNKKTQTITGTTILIIILILQIIGMLPPFLLVIGGVIGIYLILKGQKKS